MSIQLQEIKNIYVPKIQQIEYLESTEDYMQYIDTGVKIDSETAFIGTTIDFQIITMLNNSSVVAGSVLSEGANKYQNIECMVFNGVFYKDGGFDFSQNSDIYARTLATSNGKAKGISNLNLILFARNVKGLGVDRLGGTSRCTCRIFSCTIRKNGDVIRDFIPVRIGTKGYMLDKVSGELYGNSGPGDFVLGQDVGSINYSKNLQQIYQNKLIEGVDYQTYDWLKGDGSAYIDTGIIVPTEKFVCATKLRNRETRTNPNSFFAFTVRQISHSEILFPYISVISRTDEQRYYIDLTNQRSYAPFGSGAYDINIAMSSANTIQGDLMFFRSKNISFGNSPWIGDISAFSLTSLDSTFRVEMQPVRLLRPIPRNLDAQCKSRTAGECGMIDLISGKFYGNVANTGTFTVENDNNE